ADEELEHDRRDAERGGDGRLDAVQDFAREQLLDRERDDARLAAAGEGQRLALAVDPGVLPDLVLESLPLLVARLPGRVRLNDDAREQRILEDRPHRLRSLLAEAERAERDVERREVRVPVARVRLAEVDDPLRR